MKNDTVAIILYYEWSSDGRSKAARDVYHELGLKTVVFSTREDSSTPSDSEQVSFGIKKYQGDSMLSFLLSHCVFMLQASVWLLKVIFSRKIAFVHICNMPDYLMFISVIAKLFGKKVIWDIRDVTPAVWFSKTNDAELVPHGSGYKLMLNIQCWCGWLADYIFCADSNQKEYLSSNGVRSSKIDVFMNMPLINVFRWIGPNNNPDVFRLVYHGTISHRLGLDLAIRAIYKVKEEIPSVRFDIIGSGEFSDELLLLVKELKLENYVSLNPSFIPIEEIPDWVEGASGALIPNRKTFVTDNFMLSHKMLEYIKMGVPVILPKLNILTKYVKDDEAVFYEPNDLGDMVSAIKIFYKTDRSKLAENAMKFFERNGYSQNKNIIQNILHNINN